MIWSATKGAEIAAGLWGENQEVAVICGWFVQCADFLVVRCCGKEGTKKAHRRDKECGKVRVVNG